VPDSLKCLLSLSQAAFVPSEGHKTSTNILLSNLNRSEKGKN
jgi:hypothetical protein